MQKVKMFWWLLAWMLFAATTIFRIHNHAAIACSSVPPDLLQKKSVELIGEIMDLPKQFPYGESFIFKVQQVDGVAAHFLVQLGWYGHHHSLWVADHWKLNVRLHPLTPHPNPGAFDYATWLSEQGICEKGYVNGSAANQHLQNGNPVLHFWQNLRQHLQYEIKKSIPENSLAAFIAALTVGSRALMSTTEWDVFARTGTTYLIVISGIHIGLLAMGGYWMTGMVWRIFPRLCLFLPRPKAENAGALFFAFIYSALAGWVVPTQRAFIMLAVVLIGVWLQRDSPLWRRLLFAAILVVAWDPMSLYAASFWLSFVAIAWIGYAFLDSHAMRFWWQRWIRIQVMVTLGLLPLTLFYFHQFSLVTFPANFVALPWVEFILVPAGLLSCLFSYIHPALGKWGFYWTAKLLAPLWRWLVWLSSFQQAVWWHGIPNIFILLSTTAGIALLLAPRGCPWRWLGIFFVLPLWTYHPFDLKTGEIHFQKLNTEKGLAYALETKNHAIGYGTIKQQVLIRDMWLANGSLPKNIRWWNAHTPCQPGAQWEWDGVRFEWLDRLCVLHIVAKNGEWFVSRK